MSVEITRNQNRVEPMFGAVAGIVASVPAREVLNSALPAGADEAAKLTGVRARRQDPKIDTEGLCIAAAKRLLVKMDWAPTSVDALVYVTQSPRVAMPAAAYGAHHALGLPRWAPAIEVNWSCSGYVQGLWLAMQLASHSPDSRVLLLAGDTTADMVDPHDRATGPLFGDAGSATAVIGSTRLTPFVMGADGSGSCHLTRDPGVPLSMNGAEVFNFTLREVPRLVADVLDIAPSPDWLLFHQANAFMLDHLVRKIGLLETFTTAQIPMNVDRFGNCMCASLPLLLADKVGQMAAKRSRMALFGFGAGWSWAGTVLSGLHMDVVELIEV